MAFLSILADCIGVVSGIYFVWVGFKSRFAARQKERDGKQGPEDG